jgi:nitric oxide reductase subunit B
MEEQGKLSKWWLRGVLGVMIFGFTILAIMTAKTYHNAPPIPARITGESGGTIFTGEEILKGQEVFLKYALMEHGTLWGHGAYLGPDYSAAYLHREAEIVRDDIAREKFGKSSVSDLDASEQDSVDNEAKAIIKKNNFSGSTDTLLFTRGEEASYRIQLKEWADYFQNGAPGLSAGFIREENEVRSLTAYFAWASWATRAERPGKKYSYTNNWPYEPLAGNGPTPQIYLWSALSLLFLLGGLGSALFFFGRFDYLGWKNTHSDVHSHGPSYHMADISPSQKITALYFLVVIALFVLQVLLGGLLAHFRVEPQGFYGFSINSLLPYNLARSWHLQLAVFWIATAWVGGGLFLAPVLGGGESKGQKAGMIALLGALAVVVFGSLFGEYLGINNKLGDRWFIFGHQGSEYLDLGRFWQVLLAAGLLFWLFLMFRALKPSFKIPEKKTLSMLFFAASFAVVFFYLPAFMWGKHTNFAVIDNWRFWIIHLWVEGFFELFATVLVAVMFVHMRIVGLNSAVRVIYLDAILYLTGGLVGTAHHWYFTGQETIALAFGACFSALEVVPLTLLTLDAWDFIKLQKTNCPDCGENLADKQKWAIRFLMAVGFWNFVGAGVFGFLINLPIVSYFEMGTTLTPNHGHAAMFGVFGMLALAVLLYCLRALNSDANWAKSEKFIKVGFWGLNIGLLLMIVLNLFPAGVVQLLDVIKNGYAHARSTGFTMSGFFHYSEWVRLIGDMVFLLVGCIPLAIGAVLAVINSFKAREA